MLGRLTRSIARRLHFASLGRLAFTRPEKPLALKAEHVKGTQVFASREAYIETLPEGGVCAEIGVWKGDLSAHILTAAKPKMLHLVDRDLERFKVRDRFGPNPHVRYHEGRSADIITTFPDAYFDWMYIDAGHRYQDVRADATAAGPKVKPNGLLLFNDYIIWSHLEGYAYGVVPTVNQMCVSEGWRIVAFCLEREMYCNVALTRS